MPSRVDVQHATGSYPIWIEPGLLERAGHQLSDWLDDAASSVLVTDERVGELYLEKFLAEWPSEQPEPICITLLAGESSKSIEQATVLWRLMLQNGVDRRSTVIALGGGVPGDLAGFVAATYMRGIRYVQVPTSLLAQVDSSVGGKTGINMPEAKNSVGCFWQPDAVLIDPSVLVTLEPTELTSGLAEVVKYGMIMDEPFFQWLESNAEAIGKLDPPTLEEMIRRCCELKAQVVREDERETSGRRAILNYGHTFGHAIEQVFGYGKVPHGHAVAMGMNAAAYLAQQLGRIDEELVNRQQALFESLRIPYQFPGKRHGELIETMRRDKKAMGGETRFILPDRLGHVTFVDSIDPGRVRQAMQLAAKSSG